jgi:mannose/fructose/N-acetylgalactosamine-specific phosphotransferase system component IIC
MSLLLTIFLVIWFSIGFCMAVIAGIDMYKTQIKFTLTDLFMCLALLAGGLFSAIMAVLEYTDNQTVLLKKKK